MYCEQKQLMNEGLLNDKKNCYKNFNQWVLTVTDSLFHIGITR